MNETIISIDDTDINIEQIKETEIKKEERYGLNYFEYENNGRTESGYSKDFSLVDVETRIKINELVLAVKQLNRKINNLK